MPLTVQALDHLVVQVSDLEASARWYERVLGMTREDVPPEPGKPPRTAMRFGRQKINLRPIATSKEDWFTADHEAVGSEDLCFLTDRRRIRSFSICRLKASPSSPAPARGRREGALMSVYCRDPDGALIEIASYLEARQPPLTKETAVAVLPRRRAHRAGPDWRDRNVICSWAVAADTRGGVCITTAGLQRTRFTLASLSRVNIGRCANRERDSAQSFHCHWGT